MVSDRDRDAEMRRQEVEYYARIDAAEAFASFIERMAEQLGDEPVDDCAVSAADTARHDAPYDWGRAA